MDTLGLVLANDDIPDGRAREEIKDSISICPLGLLIAAPLGPLVSLHATVKGSTGGHVEGFLKDDGLLGDGELGDGEGEARGRSLDEIGLGGILVAFLTIACGVLALEETAARGGPVKDLGGLGQGREESEKYSGLHVDDEVSLELLGK